MSKETKADKNKQNFYFIWDNHLIFLAIIKASKIFTLGRKNKYFMSLVKKAVAEQICTRVWSTGKALHCAECCCRNHKRPTMDCTLHISMAIIRRASFPGGSRLTFIFLKCILKPLPTMQWSPLFQSALHFITNTSYSVPSESSATLNIYSHRAPCFPKFPNLIVFTHTKLNRQGKGC